MKQQFPTGREEKRQALLQAVAAVRDILAAGAAEAEASLTNALHWTPARLRFRMNVKSRVLAGASERGRWT